MKLRHIIDELPDTPAATIEAFDKRVRMELIFDLSEEG